MCIHIEMLPPPVEVTMNFCLLFEMYVLSYVTFSTPPYYVMSCDVVF